jgi:VPDSG-CTERM motif
MKMKMSSLFACLAVLLFATNASAITTAVVGSADTLIAADNLGNSGNEEEWIEGILGFDVDYEQIPGSDGENSPNWDAVTDDPAGTDLWAFNFGAGNGGDYFLIKTGNILSGPYAGETHFLYQNLASLQYAVIDLLELGGDITIGKVSHVGTTGTTTQVPDGGSTLLLLGAALSGLGVARRFTKF